MTPAILNHLARFRRQDRGLAAVEFALLAPFLCALLLSGYEVARFVGIRSGVDKVGFSVADVTSQYDQLSAKALSEIFRISGESLSGYASGSTGVTILTSVTLVNKKPTVKWQCYSTNQSTWTSKIGKTNGAANINSALLADAADNVMISEVYFKYKPLFTASVVKPFDMYTSSLYRPRLGSLTVSPC